MTLTYIFHSCFVLEAEKSILIFDYWLDPANVVPKFFDKRSGKDDDLQKDKPLYVFSSHFHEDHFSKEIFEWKKQRGSVTYILSKDILRHRRANKEDADVWLAKGGSWSDRLVSVKATGRAVLNHRGGSKSTQTRRTYHFGKSARKEIRLRYGNKETYSSREEKVQQS